MRLVIVFACVCVWTKKTRRLMLKFIIIFNFLSCFLSEFGAMKMFFLCVCIYPLLNHLNHCMFTGWNEEKKVFYLLYIVLLLVALYIFCCMNCSFIHSFIYEVFSFFYFFILLTMITIFIVFIFMMMMMMVIMLLLALKW